MRPRDIEQIQIHHLCSPPRKLRGHAHALPSPFRRMVRWPATQPNFPPAQQNRDRDAVAHSANASNEGGRAGREGPVSVWRAEAEECSHHGVAAPCIEGVTSYYAESDGENE